MSLINDALKRAKESQRSNPPSGARPLPPVESTARGGTGWILAVAAVLFLAAVGLFFGPTLFGHKASTVAAAKTAKTAETPPTPAEPVSAPVTNTVPATPATSPPPAVSMEQLPRLQGVIFSATRPLAIVDGKTVNVGDRVGDFQVKQILKDSVVFQRPDGSQRTLHIGE
jgi:hypothetical protein